MNYGFLDEVLPYVDAGEGTVSQHLMRGLDFTRKMVGDHGIPSFLFCDWNDSLRPITKGGKAESAFVFFQAAHAAYELKELFAHINDAEKLSWAEDYYNWCKEKYSILWDGKWFIRRRFLQEGMIFRTEHLLSLMCMAQLCSDLTTKDMGQAQIHGSQELLRGCILL